MKTIITLEVTHTKPIEGLADAIAARAFTMEKVDDVAVIASRPATPAKVSAHGHVVPRADGAKARCGGPALCSVCQREQAQLSNSGRP